MEPTTNNFLQRPAIRDGSIFRSAIAHSGVRWKQLLVAAAAAASLSSFAGTKALAGPGDLDTSFSGDGVQIVEPVISGSTEPSHFAGVTTVPARCGITDAILDGCPEDEIVAVGSSAFQAPTFVSSSTAYFSARFRGNGSLHAGYTDRLTLPAGLVADLNIPGQGRGLNKVQPARRADGSVIAAGYDGVFGDMGPSEYFAVVAYGQDGRPDSDFGGQRCAWGGAESDCLGVATDDSLGGFWSVESPIGARRIRPQAQDLVVDESGRITAVGTDGVGWTIVRFLPNGQLDGSFAGGGIARSSDWTDGSTAISVVLDSAGRAIVAGKVKTGPDLEDSAIVVARYIDGRLDASFGDGGFVTDEGTTMFGIGRLDVAVDSRDRVIVSHGVWDRTYLVRYEENGTIDTEFGNVLGRREVLGGIASSVAVDRHDGIILAGSRFVAVYSHKIWAARLTMDGPLDTEFATGGHFTYELPGFGNSIVADLSLQDGGSRIVLAGAANRAVGATWGPARDASFVMRLLGPAFCFDGRIDPGEFDADGDLVEDRCDNCVDVCNPDQEDSDGDCPLEAAGSAECGDVCDACPAHNQEEQPAECNDAFYNTQEIDCCFPIDSAAVSTDPICTGAPLAPVVVSVGADDLPAGSGSLWGPANPPGGAILKIPAGTAAGRTFSITAKNKGGKEHWVRHAAGRFVGSYEFAPHMTVATPAEAPVTVCIEWVDRDDNGRLDALPGGASFPADGEPYQYVIRERSLRLYKADAGAERDMGGPCHAQQCTAIGADGTPSIWGAGNVRLDDPSLAACCHMPTNRWCYETRSFSEYGLENDCTGSIERSSLKFKTASQKLIFKGRYQLGGGTDTKAAESFAPDLTGATIEVFDAGENRVVEIPLLKGAFSANRVGWKVNRSRDVFTYIDKRKGSQVKKVQFKRKDRRDPNMVQVKIIGQNIDIPQNSLFGPLSVQVSTGSGDPGACAASDYSADAGGFCAVNQTGSLVVCRN
jgi:uncharacterized delta-60 repeat protein